MAYRYLRSIGAVEKIEDRLELVETEARRLRKSLGKVKKITRLLSKLEAHIIQTLQEAGWEGGKEGIAPDEGYLGFTEKLRGRISAKEAAETAASRAAAQQRRARRDAKDARRSGNIKVRSRGMPA